MKRKKEILELREALYQMYSELHDLYNFYCPVKKWWGYKGDLKMASMMMEYRINVISQIKLIDWIIENKGFQTYQSDMEDLRDSIEEWNQDIQKQKENKGKSND